MRGVWNPVVEVIHKDTTISVRKKTTIRDRWSVVPLPPRGRPWLIHQGPMIGIHLVPLHLPFPKRAQFTDETFIILLTLKLETVSIQFTDESRQRQHVWQRAISNRFVGGIITTHGDDAELTLPPRSSLSVPLDLGTSIITGVEADVNSQRRPDPSSLICAQLGLELTFLNSNYPLYDTVTGQKVPGELDETLEAEYNSLLDECSWLSPRREIMHSKCPLKRV
ncbi:LSD1-like 3 [Artemisia annua]|uniref:LSD1-like 3 n=1 Tax=Artemisia annua TaxID=35608 RepID=A0A2U1PYQ6_ARTAN|nr:LSD1-like 3 [Artemisia annua]